jgi:hypothetical protein
MLSEKTKSPIWTKRWTKMLHAGLSYDQALAVYWLIDDVHGHSSQTLAIKSRDALEQVYGREATV